METELNEDELLYICTIYSVMRSTQYQYVRTIYV